MTFSGSFWFFRNANPIILLKTDFTRVRACAHTHNLVNPSRPDPEWQEKTNLNFYFHTL